MTSNFIAQLVGPTLMVVTLSESPFVQPTLYEHQTPPVVYLSGVLLFVAGLAIVRAHNVWKATWEALVTLCGWGALTLGLVRMLGASAYQQASAKAEPQVLICIEGGLFAIGAILTWKGYFTGYQARTRSK